MNFRPLYTLITSFCLATVLLIGLYYYGQDPNNEHIPSNTKHTVVQLLPKPIILNESQNTSLKNDSLEKLLKSKSTKIISLPDTDLDFSNIISTLPFDLNKISLHFHYNKNEDRVDFDGQSNHRYKSIEVSGYYKNTPYNQIHYVININDDNNELNINALYTPSTKEDHDSLTGQFILKTHSDNLLTFFSHKEDISITGNFYKTDNILKLDKISLSSNILNISADAEIFSDHVISNITISDTNLKDLVSNFNLSGMYNALFEKFQEITNNKSKTTLNLQNIEYDLLKIDNGIIKFTTKNKKLIIDKLKLITQNQITLSSKGNIYNTPFALEYDGLLNITNLSADNANHFIQLDNTSINADKDIEITSKIKISPPLLQLNNIKISQGFTESTGDIKYFQYTNNKIIKISSDIQNYSPAKKTLKIFDLISKKFNAIPTTNTEQKKNNTKIDSFTHARFNFHNFTTLNNENIQNISASYVATPKLIQLNNITTKSPNLNIDGNISFDTNKKPNALISFKGVNSNINTLYHLITNNILNCNTLEDCRPFINNLSQFSGKILFNIEGHPHDNTPLSSLSCNISVNSNLNLKDCNAALFDGKLLMNGNINISDQIKYSVNYELLKANSQLLIHNLISKQIKSEGLFQNIKGFLTSSGLDKDTFINNLQGELNIVTPKLKIEYLNLEKILRKHNVLNQIKMNKKPVAGEHWSELKNLEGKLHLDNSELISQYIQFNTTPNLKIKLSDLKYNLKTSALSTLLQITYALPSKALNTIRTRITGSVKDKTFFF